MLSSLASLDFYVNVGFGPHCLLRLLEGAPPMRPICRPGTINLLASLDVYVKNVTRFAIASKCL
jgi:hypothetical protein